MLWLIGLWLKGLWLKGFVDQRPVAQGPVDQVSVAQGPCGSRACGSRALWFKGLWLKLTECSLREIDCKNCACFAKKIFNRITYDRYGTSRQQRVRIRKKASQKIGLAALFKTRSACLCRPGVSTGLFKSMGSFLYIFCDISCHQPSLNSFTLATMTSQLTLDCVTLWGGLGMNLCFKSTQINCSFSLLAAF